MKAPTRWTFLAIASSALFGCGAASVDPAGRGPAVTVSVAPSAAAVPPGGTTSFTATVANTANLSVTWSVQENAAGGTVTSAGLYTAPSSAGTYHVVATSQADPTKSGAATVTVTTAPPPPTIASFSASPSALAAGGGTTTLSWSVAGATTLSIDHGVGTVMGTSKSVSVTSTTLFSLTATNAAGSATSATLVTVAPSGIGSDPPKNGRYAHLLAPVDGETFVGPTVDLRLTATGADPNNYLDTGPGGGHHLAAQVQFYVDGTNVLTVDANTTGNDYGFQGFVHGLSLAPGTHTVFARAIYTTNPGPAGQVDSAPVTITVEAAPTYAQTIDMAGDYSLAQAASWIGTSGARIRVNGNGYRIYGSGPTAVNWQYVDFHDLGSRGDTTANGIDIATSGNVTVRNCRFDYSNPVRFAVSGGSAATIRDNLWRSNMRQPLGQQPQPTSYGSWPAVMFTGASTGPNVFAGNNMGAGWADWTHVSNWTVGGDADADANVAIGPRVGFFFDYGSLGGGSSNIVIKGNFTHHLYDGAWSQASNYELGHNAGVLVEKNVLVGSSWTVRGLDGEFRYNLVVYGGEDWMWLGRNAYVHHNVFVGGDLNRAGILVAYDWAGIRVINNTFDGLNWMAIGQYNAFWIDTGSAATLSSNAFLNLPTITNHHPVDISGSLTTDYNLFWNSTTPYYSDGRSPAHDVVADPLFAGPVTHMFEFDQRAVWERTKSPHGVLADYRAKYLPAAGSPLIDAGDTATFGSGNAIGAIGATGTAASADHFGK